MDCVNFESIFNSNQPIKTSSYRWTIEDVGNWKLKVTIGSWIYWARLQWNAPDLKMRVFGKNSLTETNWQSNFSWDGVCVFLGLHGLNFWADCGWQKQSRRQRDLKSLGNGQLHWQSCQNGIFKVKWTWITWKWKQTQHITDSNERRPF